MHTNQFQVNGKNENVKREAIKFKLEYIKNRSQNENI